MHVSHHLYLVPTFLSYRLFSFLCFRFRFGFECMPQNKAVQRLEYEGLMGDAALTDPSSAFFRQPVAFAMDRFVYYMCYRCKLPYFGGRALCDDGLQPKEASALVCGPCSGVGTATCPTHGKDFIQYKCKFCCGTGTFFCWGTTHFCHDCHKRQENHEYMSVKKRDELPVCPGPALCPLKVRCFFVCEL